MKKITLSLTVLLLSLSATFAQGTTAQDSTGLPGDNFSLAGALELFRNSSSPEEFEKVLNARASNVNNLDLNGDGEIDYIKVVDKKDGDNHAFILQDAVSETEDQDVAVIELEKTGNETISLQIVGDKDLYGEEVVMEPAPENTITAPAATTSVAPVNVYAWPAVRYVYTPTYGIWISPYRWRAHPMWWHPWRPVAPHVFYPYRTAYHQRYAVAYTPRPYAAHRSYTPARTVSATVQTRNQTRVTQYRATRATKRTTVTNGNGRVTRKTTTVRGRNGKTTRTRAKVRKN